MTPGYFVGAMLLGNLFVVERRCLATFYRWRFYAKARASRSYNGSL